MGEMGAFKMFGPFNSKDRAIANFHSKFKAKTKNAWADRANFVKYSGKYDLVETDWSSGDQDTGGASSSSHSVSSSMPVCVLSLPLLSLSLSLSPFFLFLLDLWFLFVVLVVCCCSSSSSSSLGGWR